MRQIRYVTIFLVLLGMFSTALAQAKPGQNVIKSLEVNQLEGKTILMLGFASELVAPPSNFVIANPARIVFDFPATENGLGFNNKVVNQGVLRSYSLLQAGSRSRLVLNLDSMSRFDVRHEKDTLQITLLGGQLPETVATPQAATDSAKAALEKRKKNKPRYSLIDIQFRRNQAGSGLIQVDLSSQDIPIDVKQKGSSLFVSFADTDLPDSLKQKLDVVDFGTPVNTVVSKSEGKNVLIEIMPTGLWEHTAYQTDKQFIVEISPVKEDPSKLFQGTRKGYQGEAISLNFQNIPLRELLHVFADITNFNIVISDSVGGNVSLRLNDVPWDQALEIVLQQKNLAMRKNGSVIWIASQSELAARDQLVVQARESAVQAIPPRMEGFQLNYIRAEELRDMLTKDQSYIGDTDDRGASKGAFLSSQGVITVDKRTNQMFVYDSPEKLDLIASLVKKIDKPVKQVMIEARIVEASDSFQKTLGARLGIMENAGFNGHRAFGRDNTRFIVGGSTVSTGYMTGQVEDQPDYLREGMSTNLPAGRVGTSGAQAGQFALTLFNKSKTQFLNMELSALELDGRGKIISSPRVVTADQVEASIEQGTEVPYLSASSSGATTVSFKKAVLSLKVEPQITPDGRIMMKLEVDKDSPNPQYSTSYGIAIDTKTVKTDVLIENGGTVVIGGIYQQDERNSVTQIPLFGDLPVIGRLFRNTEKQNLRSELLVFITPKIISETSGVPQ